MRQAHFWLIAAISPLLLLGCAAKQNSPGCVKWGEGRLTYGERWVAEKPDRRGDVKPGLRRETYTYMLRPCVGWSHVMPGESAPQAANFMQPALEQPHAVARIRLPTYGGDGTFVSVSIHIDNQSAAYVFSTPPKKEIVVRIPPGTRKVSAYLERSEIRVDYTNVHRDAKHLDLVFEQGGDYVLFVEVGYYLEGSQVHAYRTGSATSARLEKSTHMSTPPSVADLEKKWAGAK